MLTSKGGDGKRFGLAAICAGNVCGVPEEGAPNCLEALVRLFGVQVMGVARRTPRRPPRRKHYNGTVYLKS